MIDSEATDNVQADRVIESAMRCYGRGEIEPGVKRGKCHVLRPDESGKCFCGDVDLSKYSKMILG